MPSPPVLPAIARTPPVLEEANTSPRVVSLASVRDFRYYRAVITSSPAKRGIASMARKTLNRKELRDQVDAAERAQAEAPPKKAPAKRKSRAKTPVDVRVRLYWAVYNQSLKRVALYEFNQKKQAEQKAEALNASGKSPHFVKKEKLAIDEAPTPVASEASESE
jgi:hypothetical protein